MSIGEMRHRITLQRFSATINENGYEIQEWLNVKTVWALVSNLSGTDYFQAAQIQAKNTVKFTIRYLPGIDPAMRILFGDKVYSISAIDNHKYRNRYLEIKAMEVDAGG